MPESTAGLSRMSWSCINPAEIVAALPDDNPVGARQVAADSITGKLRCVFRDGLNWGDERLWYCTDPSQPRPFNLSPLLPDDFPLYDPAEMFACAESAFRNGDWKLGWQLYELRHSMDQGRDQMPRLFMPHWDGRSKCRRLMVHAHQGAGDAIMFARYLMELDRRGVRSCLVVPPPLIRLMRSLPYKGDVIDYIDDSCDCHIPIESLPLALGIYEPMQCAPYLGPALHPSRDSQARIGIVWAGQPSHPRNIVRSLTLEQCLEYVPWGDFISLQMGEAKQQLQFAPHIRDGTAGITDWLDTAAILAELDLLVCVDTGIAHLAGAMGLPVKLLAREPVEWRWGNGASTPWYDSMLVWRLPPASHFPVFSAALLSA